MPIQASDFPGYLFVALP